MLKLIYARLEEPTLILLLLESDFTINKFDTQLQDIFPEDELKVLKFQSLIHLLTEPLLEVSLGHSRDARFLCVLLVFLLEDRKLQLCNF